MPPIGSFGVPLIQGEPSMVSHLIQPVRPLPTASLLPFLLRQPEGHRGQQNAPFRPPIVTGLDLNRPHRR